MDLGGKKERMHAKRRTAALGLIVPLFVMGLVTVLPIREAAAHGGRYKPPEPKYKPGDGGRVPRDPPPDRRWPKDPGPPAKPPPGFKPPVTPPSDPSPEIDPRKRPVTGGRKTGAARRRGIPSTTPRDAGWEMWWELNRWDYFPERGLAQPDGAPVVTPAPAKKVNIDRRAMAAQQRALVARQQIVPFLLTLLDPKKKTRDEVRAAALLALTKITHDDAAVELVFTYAENKKASGLVRESAALAVGMIRRTSKALAKNGASIDMWRERLIMLVDDKKAPDRTRAFAALSIGMLGDQPFGNAFTKDGRMITRSLWARAQIKHSSNDVPVALLTSLGMQPRAGISAEVKQGLQRIVNGRRIGGRGWDAVERSHALTALVRQEGAGWPIALSRVMTVKRIPAEVRRAAFITLGAKSSVLNRQEREQAVEACARGVDLSRDNLTRGLGLIALGRLLGADLQADCVGVVERTKAPTTLLKEARGAVYGVRGFAAIGLALAMRGSSSSNINAVKFQKDGLAILTRGFAKMREARVRSAYVVALGLLGKQAQASEQAMTEILMDRRADAELRGHAALSLAWMETGSEAARKAMRTAILDRRSVELRSQAALALSFLGGRAESTMLVVELRKAKSQWVLAQVAAALGQLGDVGAVPAILEVASDTNRQEEARALAIASLGLLGDPEPKPSMLRLTRDANYPARTNALDEALSIL